MQIRRVPWTSGAVDGSLLGGSAAGNGATHDGWFCLDTGLRLFSGGGKLKSSSCHSEIDGSCKCEEGKSITVECIQLKLRGIMLE